MTPTKGKRISDRGFRYVPSYRTDIRVSIQRARNALAEEAFQQLSPDAQARVRAELQDDIDRREY